MPAARVFIDSNTFLYTVDGSESEKGARAQQWLTTLTITDAGVTNLQVLNEVASVLTRKTSRFGNRDPFLDVDAFATFGSSPLSNAATLAARTLFARHNYAWWDCLLLASAIELGCTHFLSEDLQDDQVLADGAKRLTIIDPFAHSPEQILSRR